jgi:hypothetical protein
MGSGKAAASTTPTAKMVLRARAGRHAGGSKGDKDERDRTHAFDLHVAPSLNACLKKELQDPCSASMQTAVAPAWLSVTANQHCSDKTGRIADWYRGHLY